MAFACRRQAERTSPQDIDREKNMSRHQQRSPSSASCSSSSSYSEDQQTTKERPPTSFKRQRHRKKGKSHRRQRSPSSASSSSSSSGSDGQPAVEERPSLSSKSQRHEHHDENPERHKSNKSRMSEKSKKPQKHAPPRSSEDASTTNKEKPERSKKRKTQHSGQHPQHEEYSAQRMCHRPSTKPQQNAVVMEIMRVVDGFTSQRKSRSRKNGGAHRSVLDIMREVDGLSPANRSAASETATCSSSHTSKKTKPITNPEKPLPKQPAPTDTPCGSDSDVPLQRKKHLSQSDKQRRRDPVTNSTDSDDAPAPLEQTKHSKKQPSPIVDVHKDDVNSEESSSRRTQRPRRSLPEIGGKTKQVKPSANKSFQHRALSATVPTAPHVFIYVVSRAVSTILRCQQRQPLSR